MLENYSPEDKESPHSVVEPEDHLLPFHHGYQADQHYFYEQDYFKKRPEREENGHQYKINTKEQDVNLD